MHSSIQHFLKIISEPTVYSIYIPFSCNLKVCVAMPADERKYIFIFAIWQLADKQNSQLTGKAVMWVTVNTDSIVEHL